MPKANFWDEYYGLADLRDVVVLDPFVGGGTSVVEALRLGATAHAVDVDPVACAVSNFQVNATQLPDLSEALADLRDTVGKKIRRFHVTRGSDGVERVVLHHFWVQVVRCDSCDYVFDAQPNFALGEEGTRRWVICSHCGDIHRRHVRHKRFRCGSCGARTEIAQGTVTRGTARCPQCRNRRPLIEVGRASGTPPVWRLFALEVLDEPDGGRPVPIAKRRFVRASEDDIALYQAAEDELRTRWLKEDEWLPWSAVINPIREDSRLIDYGYRKWTDLFNARQLLHLSLLAQAIAKFDGAVRDGLSMAFSSHLTTNCMMSAYTGKWRRLTPLFSIRAFRHIQRPVELNPWCDGTGRGTFPNTVRKLMRASRFARDPKEPTVGGGFQKVPRVDPNEPPNVVCGTARDLKFLPDRTVDLVLTDPPYFDNISYSELAEFFVPWLELLNLVYDPNARQRISIESLVGSRNNANTFEEYAKGLGAAFSEVDRVLKTNGLLVFSFRHSLPDAWKALALGLAESGLAVMSLFPLPGEAGNSLHAHSGSALWDAVFVMRKTEQSSRGRQLKLTAGQIDEVKKLVAEWAEALEEAPIPFSRADRLTLLRAGLVGKTLGANSVESARATIPLGSALSDSARDRSR